ncbi:MAG: DUF4276 family protein [Bacteroidales bacterium]
MSKFIRLNITAEGQTEEQFVKNTLSRYLGAYNISTDVRCVLTSRDKRKSHRGGLNNYNKAKKDIQCWLKEDKDPNARFSTMFDLYALPTSFPKFREAQNINDPYKKVEFLEKTFEEDINDKRFIPYIQLHEFETLILSKPQKLKWEYFEHSSAITKLTKVLNEHKNNPELINENPETAPSKRIIKLIPEYDKVGVGADIAGIIGIDYLKKNCKHFNDWIERLKKI